MTPSSPPAGLTARELRVLVAVFALTLPAVTARLYSSDEVQYYSYLRSLWFDRDVSFENEYRAFYDRGIARTPGFQETFLEPRTPTGRRENFGTVGSAILWSPFYAAGDVTARVLRALGSGVAVDGYSRPYIAAAAYGSASLGFAALLLSMGAARRITGRGVLPGLAVWLGTPLLFYMYAAPLFAHAPSAFAVALFVTVWLRVRERWRLRGLVALGASAALMVMVREQDVFYAAGPAVDFALASLPARTMRSAGTRLAWAAAGAGTFVLLYSPQLAAYVSLNARPGPSALVTRKMNWLSPHAAGVLASAQHGLFVWTPLAALAVVGLAVHWRRSQQGGSEARVTAPARLAGCLILMFALQVYVSGSVESWTVAGAFGQRRFVGGTILLVIGLAALTAAVPSGWPRRVLAAAVVCAVWWNLGLMALFGAHLMDRQRLHPSRNAYDVFVRLPRMAPALGYRYLVDRESFYGARAPGEGS